MIINDSDISPNIAKALELDNDRKRNMIESTVHKPLVRSFLEFAGAEGSNVLDKFRNGESIYVSAVMQKQAAQV